MSISNYGELAFLNSLRGTAFSVATVYVKLHTADSGEDGTLNAAANTTRQVVSFSAASAGSMVSSATVTWTSAMVTTTETYSHWSLWDSATVGNCLWTGALSSSASVTAGDVFQITSLTLSLD